jgi:hypothetical protein
MKLKVFSALFFFCSFLCTFILLLGVNVSAQEFNSTNYKVLDPVINSGGYGTSTNFGLYGVLSQISTGTSTATNFGDNAGFLYFPFASSPIVSATPGDASVSLSWTASIGYLGWTASGYNIGQSTVSGGPYTYTSLGNVLTSNRTGLTNGTPYYFVVVVKDFFGNAIATSTQVSSTPVSPTPTPSPTPSGGGGGGGGGPITPPSSNTGVNFFGRAYPNSTITLLKDAQVAATTVAGSDAKFQISLTNVSVGNYIFSVYSEDKNGIRSSLLTFPVSVTYGATTNVTGIFIAPTISTDKSEVKKGDNIAIFGQSAPTSEITITVNSEQEFFVKTPSDDDGVYLLNFDSSLLELGNHSTKSKAAVQAEISSFGNTATFIVGTKNVLKGAPQKMMKCDLNEDGRCNLVDFSIAAFWYKKTLSPEFAIREKDHLNGDGKIDLIDFSIMAFYWTG